MLQNHVSFQKDEMKFYMFQFCMKSYPKGAPFWVLPEHGGLILFCLYFFYIPWFCFFPYKDNILPQQGLNALHYWLQKDLHWFL